MSNDEWVEKLALKYDRVRERSAAFGILSQDLFLRRNPGKPDRRPVSWKLPDSKAKGNNYDLFLSVNLEMRVLCQIMGIEVVMRYEKNITKKVAGDRYRRGAREVEDRGVREFKNGRGVIFLASDPRLSADFSYDLKEESEMIAKLEAEGWRKVEAK